MQQIHKRKDGTRNKVGPDGVVEIMLRDKLRDYAYAQLVQIEGARYGRNRFRNMRSSFMMDINA